MTILGIQGKVYLYILLFLLLIIILHNYYIVKLSQKLSYSISMNEDKILSGGDNINFKDLKYIHKGVMLLDGMGGNKYVQIMRYRNFINLVLQRVDVGDKDYVDSVREYVSGDISY